MNPNVQKAPPDPSGNAEPSAADKPPRKSKKAASKKSKSGKADESSHAGGETNAAEKPQTAAACGELRARCDEIGLGKKVKDADKLQELVDAHEKNLRDANYDAMYVALLPLCLPARFMGSTPADTAPLCSGPRGSSA